MSTHAQASRCGVVYIIELCKPLVGRKRNPANKTQVARYYVGSTRRDFHIRMNEHRNGKGAALLAYCNTVGIDYKVAWIESGGLDREYKIKALKNTAKYVERVRAQCNKKVYGIRSIQVKKFTALALQGRVTVVQNQYGIWATFEAMTIRIDKKAAVLIRAQDRIRKLAAIPKKSERRVYIPGEVD